MECSRERERERERSRDLVAGERDVRTVDEAIAFNGFVRREIGDVTVVNGGLVCSQVELVSQIEQIVWRRCHCSVHLFFFLAFFAVVADLKRS